MRAAFRLLPLCGAVAAVAATVPARADDPPVQPSGPPPEVPEAPAAPKCLGLEVPEVRFSALEIDWRVGAWVALDAIAYGSDNPRDDSLGATDFRPLVEARSGPFSLRVEGDVIGVDTPRNLYEAWAAWQAAPWLRASAGQFRVALGSEFATHERDLPFVGYGFTSHLDGRYDAGLRLDGEPVEGLWYQATATTGHGFDLEGHRRTSPMLALRGVLNPFRALGARDDGLPGALRGLHAGVAWAHLTDGDDPVIVSTPLQSRVFDTSDLDADSGRWLHLEFGFTSGPFALGFERVTGSTDGVPVPGGGTEDMDDHTAFTWSAALNLTGEPRGWRDGAFVPATAARTAGGGLLPFLPEGRWELAARYSNGDLERDLIDTGYTTSGVSTQEVRTFSAALFWEPCARMRVGLEWVKTIADDDIAAFGATDRDSSFVLRLELRF